MLTVISYVAAILTTCSFIPQALKVIKTKDTSGLSLGMYSIFTLGVIIWTIYGFLAREFAVALANAITLLFAGVILKYIIDNQLKSKGVRN